REVRVLLENSKLHSRCRQSLEHFRKIFSRFFPRGRHEHAQRCLRWLEGLPDSQRFSDYQRHAGPGGVGVYAEEHPPISKIAKQWSNESRVEQDVVVLRPVECVPVATCRFKVLPRRSI